jgi:hypothetical protein
MGSRTGIVILSIFATLWLAISKLNLAPITWPVIFGGACVSSFLIFLSYRLPRQSSAVSAAESKRVGRIYMWSSIGEGIGIFLIVNILANVGLADRFMAGIALAVGLHFIPPAVLIPRRGDLCLAAVLLVVAAVGFAIPSAPHAALFVGVMGALTLWSGVGAEIFLNLAGRDG